MSSRPSPSKSNRATPPFMLSTMYFFSEDEKLVNLMPAALVTSVKVTSPVPPAERVTGRYNASRYKTSRKGRATNDTNFTNGHESFVIIRDIRVIRGFTF